MRTRSAINSNCPPGLSLVELLIAIGILGVTMMLIAAAFPAGVAMSIAVSDDTTSQSVFQHGLGVVRDNYSVVDVAAIDLTDLPDSDYYGPISDIYLGRDAGGNYDPDADPPLGLANRQYGGLFSWSMLLKRMAGAGPMGNLCQAVIVVSRKGTGSGDYVPDPTVGGDEADADTWSTIPELRSVRCTGSNQAARILEIHEDDFDLVPSEGYMIDGETGVVYYIVSRSSEDDHTVTVFSEPPSNAEIDGERYFWVVPGQAKEVSGDVTYGRRSPAIRVFQAMLYLP